MLSTILKSKFFYIILGYYLYLLVWWITIFASGQTETFQNYLFGIMYALVALAGCIYGLWMSHVWGGFNSVVGRSIIYFSLGLFGLFFGQATWSYYNLIAKIEVPYPSIGDIGYFSIIPLYAMGMLNLARASFIKGKLRNIKGKLIAFVIPTIMVTICYGLFLKDVQSDFSDPIRTFFDFGYPLGEAITISIALITFSLSQKLLGGYMRNRILLLIFALVIQYLTDYLFLYRVGTGEYYNGGPVDMMYATSFFIMTIGLISLHEIPNS